MLINHLKIIRKDGFCDKIIVTIMKHVIEHIVKISNEAIKEPKELPTIGYLITPDIDNIINGIIHKFIKRIKSQRPLANAIEKLKPRHAGLTQILTFTILTINNSLLA